MGPPASAAFLCIGIALMVLPNASHRRARKLAVILGLSVICISALSLAGYLYGAQPMYTIPRLTAIAMQTATVVFALGVSLVASIPERQPLRGLLEPDAGGMLIRRLLPLMIVIPLVLGYLRILAQNAGLVDTAFGTAIRTLIELALLAGMLWWAAAMVGKREKQLGQQQKKLAERDHLLRTVTNHTRVGLAIVSPEHRYLYANQAYAWSWVCRRTTSSGNAWPMWWGRSTNCRFAPACNRPSPGTACL